MNPRSIALSGAVLLAGTVALTTALKPSPMGSVLPGITREMVCDRGYAGRVRHTTQAQKDQVLRLAGVNPADRAKYEVDHIVPLSSGGADVVANLQAQPWDGPDGAHAKDRIEAFCWREVCAGRMTLAESQSLFRTRGGWQAAYEKFGLGKVKAGESAGDEPEYDDEGFPR